MLSGAILLSGIALWCWPDGSARKRIDSTRSDSVHHVRTTVRSGTVLRIASVPLFAGVGASVAGLGGLCAASALATLGLWYRRHLGAMRYRKDRTVALAAALRLMVAELRVGSHPAAAAEGAGAEAPHEVADVFRRMAAAVRLGADIGSSVQDKDQRDPVGELLDRISRAWALAERHGIALADVLDSVRRDVEHRVEFAARTEASMAGPRATASVLAALPGIGLLLGEATGSAPLQVLAGSPVGQVLLVLGVGLLCIGVVWTARLTEVVVRV